MLKKLTNVALFSVLAFVVAVLSFVELASAALDLTAVTFNMVPIEAYALVIITALAVMWVIRKAIKTTNRS